MIIIIMIIIMRSTYTYSDNIDKWRKHMAIHFEIRSESSLECDNSSFKISYEINNTPACASHPERWVKTVAYLKR